MNTLRFLSFAGWTGMVVGQLLCLHGTSGWTDASRGDWRPGRKPCPYWAGDNGYALWRVAALPANLHTACMRLRALLPLLCLPRARTRAHCARRQATAWLACIRARRVVLLALNARGGGGGSVKNQHPILQYLNPSPPFLPCHPHRLLLLRHIPSPSYLSMACHLFLIKAAAVHFTSFFTCDNLQTLLQLPHVYPGMTLPVKAFL